jgi:hypothetical protein
VWCGTETIGDRRAGLSEIKPGPARGELSSPSGLIHPGEDRPMARRDIEQLSWFDAVQLRCAKGTASNRVSVWPGTASLVLPRSVDKDARSPCEPRRPNRRNRLRESSTRASPVRSADFVRCRLRARSDGLRSACGSACTADVPPPDRCQRLNPGGLRRTGDAWHQRLPTGSVRRRIRCHGLSLVCPHRRCTCSARVQLTTARGSQ